MACNRLNIACLLAAGSGILILLSIATVNVYPYLPAAVSIVSLAIGIHNIRCVKIQIISSILIILSWILTIFYARLSKNELIIIVSISIQYLATALAITQGGAEAGLPIFASSYATLIVLFSWSNPTPIGILSFGYIVLGGIIAGLLSSRPHPVAAVLASPIALIVNPQVAVMLSLLAYSAILAGSGAIKWVGCPFRTDSGLVFAGTIVGVIGALLGETMVSMTMVLGLYSSGLLLLLAGILTPASPVHMKPS